MPPVQDDAFAIVWLESTKWIQEEAEDDDFEIHYNLVEDELNKISGWRELPKEKREDACRSFYSLVRLQV